MTDRAVVVGISDYPELRDLGGPCHDATAVADWLRRPDGGGLTRPGQIDLLLTTDFDPATGVHDAKPVSDDVANLFRPLVRRATEGAHEDGRLFIYVAGHGFADPQDYDSAALYVANAEPAMPLHVAVTRYAEWFRRNWAFDEIIVLVDCCRDTTPLLDVADPTLPRTRHANAGKVKMFYGFATGWGQAARERSVDGVVRGIFTSALVDALEHAPANRLGRVTGTAVRDYVHNVIDRHGGGSRVPPPDIDADDRKDVLFTERAVDPTLQITFRLSPPARGQELVVQDGAFTEVYRQVVAAETVVVPLPPGLHKATVAAAGITRLFEVPSDGPIDL